MGDDPPPDAQGRPARAARRTSPATPLPLRDAQSLLLGRSARRNARGAERDDSRRGRTRTGTGKTRLHPVFLTSVAPAFAVPRRTAGCRTASRIVANVTAYGPASNAPLEIRPRSIRCEATADAAGLPQRLSFRATYSGLTALSQRTIFSSDPGGACVASPPRGGAATRSSTAAVPARCSICPAPANGGPLPSWAIWGSLAVDCHPERPSRDRRSSSL
jgi:hypothetical protein